MDLLKINNEDLNNILNRSNVEKEIINLLNNFDNMNNINNVNQKSKNNKNTNSNINLTKCIYLYGNSGIGKTTFIMHILNKLNYDILYYDNTSIRNKNLIDSISNNNIGNQSISNLFNKKQKKLIIVIDDLYAMNFGDKNGINSLIKLIRYKKTKKQLKESYTNNPIICINNNYTDKKILELMKISNNIELLSPNNEQLNNLLNHIYPNLYKYNKDENIKINNNIINFLNNSLIGIKKLDFYYKNNFIYDKFYNFYQEDIINNSKNIKNHTHKLLNKNYNFNNINSIIESDRTIISLIFHENIIYLLKDNLKLYLKILNNFIFSDYIDRIIFQKQIWQLTEINYIIKIFYNNFLLNENNLYKNLDDIIFTKILTKYSAEYNNFIFIYNLMQNLLIDKKDLLILFNNKNINTNNNDNFYNISKLELIRIIKLFDNLINNNININNDYDNDNDFNNINCDKINNDSEYFDYLKSSNIELYNDYINEDLGEY